MLAVFHQRIGHGRAHPAVLSAVLNKDQTAAVLPPGRDAPAVGVVLAGGHTYHARARQAPPRPFRRFAQGLGKQGERESEAVLLRPAERQRLAPGITERVQSP